MVKINDFSRVFRGGSWYNSAGYCEVNGRLSYYPDNGYDNLGFRVLRRLQ